MNFFDINKFKILSEIRLKDSNGVIDITNTAEKGVYALGCRKGLIIVKANKKLTMISDHLQGKSIRVITYISHKKVILGIGFTVYLTIFDYG